MLFFFHFDKNVFFRFCYFLNRSLKEKGKSSEITSNIPEKTDKQEEKTSVSYNRREKESSRERDRPRRGHYSSQTSGSRHRDHDDYQRQNSGNRRRYSPRASSRERRFDRYDRRRGKVLTLKYFIQDYK